MLKYDETLYRSNSFYREIVNHSLQNEKETQELKNLISTLKETLPYASQLPYHNMTQISNTCWQASYITFENNYVNYWNAQANEDCELLLRKAFNSVIRCSTRASTETAQIASVALDSLGILSANNIFDAVSRAMSIINTATGK